VNHPASGASESLGQGVGEPRNERGPDRKGRRVRRQGGSDKHVPVAGDDPWLGSDDGERVVCLGANRLEAMP
jgi:hypothetical protein